MDNSKRLRTYMGTASGWYKTDDGYMQHRRKVTEDEYDLIQLMWWDTTEGDPGYPDREYIVIAAHIDLLETNWKFVSDMLTRQEAENLIEEYIGFCNNITLVC